MDDRKYEILMDEEHTIQHNGRTLHRIRSLGFSRYSAGTLGGYIENEKNLSHKGSCWVADNAKVYDNAKVFNDATMYNTSEAFGYARVYGNARMNNNSKISEHACIYGEVNLWDNVHLKGTFEAYEKIHIDCIKEFTINLTSRTDLVVIKGLGSADRNTSFFIDRKSGIISVCCGCFSGTLYEFRKKVEQRHGQSKYAKEYLMAADLIEFHFKEGVNNDNN